MILTGLLWLLTWPLTIVTTYYLVKFALKKFETKLEDVD
jgi:hypothetical protein